MASARTKQATRSALTVFTVNTPAEAVEAITTFCVLRYDDSCGWTDWPRRLDPNDYAAGEAARASVTRELRTWWNERQQRMPK